MILKKLFDQGTNIFIHNLKLTVKKKTLFDNGFVLIHKELLSVL